ncbi:LytR/AlgR family response regulator transcription factor [Flavobacterium kingsejongi]|uniref:Transcriptional regulator n=1 Tax=Flavobacterium kingsejongi TaxID=1678728 RepID=A0A2S1LRJ9_9FLAO|nr:LytTR family DNA-binding domain-containing protein [Flavobacterium kingsejongi]AWG26383.1 transcriptional regulator [Flavobacterium kingsejongi]
MKDSFAFIKTDKKLIKLYYKEITVIKGLGNYVEINLLDGQKHLYYKSLKELIETLPEEFMRVHNSYIVNLDSIDRIEDNHVIVQYQKIAIAKSYKNCLITAIEKRML